MNVYELEKMAGEWREIESRGFHALWPKAWPKAKRTSEYIDKCKIADFNFTRHCRNNFLKALEALRECVTDHNAFCHTSESIENAHRRISAINRTALSALAELEET